MVGKRIIIIVIVVLLCSCLNVAAFADSVSQYSDAGGYDDTSPAGGVHGEEIGILATPTVYHAPLIYPLLYEIANYCPHCGATGSEYIVAALPLVSGYQRFACNRCSCSWIPALGGMRGRTGVYDCDLHLHYLGDGVFCPYTVGIDHGYDYSVGEGRREVQFYCHIHNLLSSRYAVNILFEFNTRWGLRVFDADDWVQPTPQTSHAWETPFVPPYDSFATLEPVSVDNVGDIVNDTVGVVKVVYKGFPYFNVLLTIAIACAFIIVVVRG